MLFPTWIPIQYPFSWTCPHNDCNQWETKGDEPRPAKYGSERWFRVKWLYAWSFKFLNINQKNKSELKHLLLLFLFEKKWTRELRSLTFCFLSFYLSTCVRTTWVHRPVEKVDSIAVNILQKYKHIQESLTHRILQAKEKKQKKKKKKTNDPPH